MQGGMVNRISASCKIEQEIGSDVHLRFKPERLLQEAVAIRQKQACTLFSKEEAEGPRAATSCSLYGLVLPEAVDPVLRLLLNCRVPPGKGRARLSAGAAESF
jgi:hypothetical protein